MINSKNQVTGVGYDIFSKKQSKTEIAKAITNPIKTPADLITVPAQPE
jgi:hypothetical protein